MMELRRLAKKYMDGEELRYAGKGAMARAEGLSAQMNARKEARALGYTLSDVLDEVAQIEVEDDSK